MTDKELEKLNRRQLLEMLLEQTKRADALEADLEEACKLIEERNKQLANKQINLEKAGNIAEAAIRINKVFEAAQKAADQYLENVKACSERCDEMIENTKKRCLAIERQALERVATLKSEVDRLRFDRNNKPSE